MKKLTLIAALFAVTGVANAQATFGGSGEVQFMGKINTDACTINGGSTQVVNLGELTAAQVLPTGTALEPSNSKRFVIDVVCESGSVFQESDPADNPTVTMTFQPTGTVGTNLALGAPNTAGNGNTVAGGVAIAMAKGDIPAPMDMSNTTSITLDAAPNVATPGTYSYVFYANYIATVAATSDIRGGDANAILPFTLSYQ